MHQKYLADSVYKFFIENRTNEDVFEEPFHIQGGMAQYNIKMDYKRSVFTEFVYTHVFNFIV